MPIQGYTPNRNLTKISSGSTDNWDTWYNQTLDLLDEPSILYKITAAEDLSQGEVAAILDDGYGAKKAYLATSATYTFGDPIGISAETVTSGNPVHLTLAGRAQNNGWSFGSSDKNVYLSASGTVTTTTTSVKLGYVISSAAIYFRPEDFSSTGGQTNTVSGASGITNTGDNVDATLAPTYGSSANTICQGNDSRLHTQNTDQGTSGSSFEIDYAGNSARLLSTGLNANRDYTFPDATTKLVGESAAATVTGDHDYSGGTLRLPGASGVPTFSNDEGDAVFDTTNDDLYVGQGGTNWKKMNGGTIASQDANSVAITGGTIDGVTIGGSTPLAGAFTTLNTTGEVVFNEAGADVNLRIEGDTEVNLFFADAGNDRIGIGTNAPAKLFHVKGGSPEHVFEDSAAAADSRVWRWFIAGGNLFLGTVNDAWSASETAMIVERSGTSIVDVSFPNGNVGIGAESFGSSADSVLGIKNGTIPGSSPADMIQLYAEDISSSSELRVRDEAGNITTLSPHNFTLFTPDVNESMPWSYYSKNLYLGKEINVDLAGAIRAVEQLTGKKFIYENDLPVNEKEDWDANQTAIAAEKREEAIKERMKKDEITYDEADALTGGVYTSKSPPAWLQARGVN